MFNSFSFFFSLFFLFFFSIYSLIYHGGGGSRFLGHGCSGGGNTCSRDYRFLAIETIYFFFLIYSFCIILLMGHGVGYYIGLNEIGSPSPIKTFITINYLFNFIFGFIR